MNIVDLVRMLAEPLDVAVVLTDIDLERPGPTVLYANPAFTIRILNLPEVESRRLLQTLFAAATAEALTWRHDWQAGDVLIWDNRSVLHTASSGPALEVLRIEGDQPTGVDALDMPWVMAG